MISRKTARDRPPRRERPFVELKDVLEDFLFPSRVKDFRPVIDLDLADLGSQAGSLVDGLEDLGIELVDAGSQALDLRERLGR